VWVLASGRVMHGLAVGTDVAQSSVSTKHSALPQPSPVKAHTPRSFHDQVLVRRANGAGEYGLVSR